MRNNNNSSLCGCAAKFMNETGGCNFISRPGFAFGVKE